MLIELVNPGYSVHDDASGVVFVMNFVSSLDVVLTHLEVVDLVVKPLFDVRLDA